eukprot:4483281-Amphidinium_carterae.1
MALDPRSLQDDLHVVAPRVETKSQNTVQLQQKVMWHTLKDSPAIGWEEVSRAWKLPADQSLRLQKTHAEPKTKQKL